MKKKILVSLVSEQTIPNVELIKEFQDEISKFVFISTKQMNHQLNWIINSTGIPFDEFDVIEVNAFDTADIEQKINNYDFGDDEIILNITGGTKLMSLIVHDIFKNMGTTIYYLTGHKKSYIKVFPSRGENLFQLKHKLTLREYLTAYGFEYKNTKPYKDFETAKRIFQVYTSLGGNELKKIFEPFRIRRGRKMDVDHITGNFLQKVNYEFNGRLKEKDTKYLSGDWLEEYVYFSVKQELKLDEEEIATGLNLKKEGTPNEIDVVFIYNHKLFIIECKTSIFDKRTIKRIREGKEVEEEKQINLLPEVIYKSDALRGKFGLFANTSIITLEEIKDKSGKPLDNFQVHFDRAELSRINIISKKDIISDKNISSLINIQL
jgi:hypothetical protein